MMKLRLTFIDDEKGKTELESALEELRLKFKILNESKVYQGRNGSLYSNIYLDIEQR